MPSALKAENTAFWINIMGPVILFSPLLTWAYLYAYNPNLHLPLYSFLQNGLHQGSSFQENES